MDKLLIVNADDFGLCKGVNYGIIEAARHGIVNSTTAMVNAPAIDHAAELSAQVPTLGVGLHFVLSYGRPLSFMPSLTRDGMLGKWIGEVASSGLLNLDEVSHELDCQYHRFIDIFGRKPTHIDSHHHVHMIPQIFARVSDYALAKGVPLRVDRRIVAQNALPLNEVRSSEQLNCDFYADNVTEDYFLHVLDDAVAQNYRSLEIMCHPAFVDDSLLESKYCFPRLKELDILTSPALRQAIADKGFTSGNFSQL